ncbi:hypothetical protein JCM3765_000068 [Sporobolomyces pararoseus]
MDSQRIRPSLADLTTLDLDAPAFTEWEINHQQPSVSVSRTQPPKIVSSSSTTSIPPPVPEIQFDQPTASTSTSTPPAPAPPSKPKSRFALQREKAAAAAAQRTERFELNLEDHDNDHDNLDNGNSSAGGGGGGALPKATPKFSVVKDVLEKPLNHSPKPPSAPSIRSTGFPPIRKGVFQQQQYKKPISTTTTTTTPRSFEADEYYLDDDGGGDSVDGLLRIVSKENESVLNRMSDSQILEEQRQIREEMGLSQGLIRMLQNRAEQKEKEKEKKKMPTPRSRPLPQRKTPTPIVQQDEEEEEEEEGTPEYIRKHFFPNEPVNPALDWMKPPPLTSSSDSSSLPSTFTFDLDGSLVSKTFNVEQGEGGGDHHVSSSTNFTIPALLSLTSSSVPSQRSTAFLTLLKIISHPSNHSLLIGEKDWNELRLKLLEKASWSLNDSNRGVIISSIDLLHYLFITELERGSNLGQGQEKNKKKVLPNQEIPKTFLDKFNLSNNPLRFISLQFSLKSCTLPRSCLNQLLEILSIYVQLSQNEEELDSSSSKNLDLIFSTSPNLLQSISERFISVSWPSTSSGGNELIPSPLALEIFINLTNSSRTCAKHFYKGDNNNDNNNQLVESTLRYLAIPPWEELQEKETTKLGYEMFSKVLKFWGNLGKYGLGSELRSLSSSLLEGGGGEGGGGGIFDKISEICLNNDTRVEEEEEDLVWISELISLLKIWLVCAVDPHVCQHGISWSKVENWNELGLQLYNYSLSSRNKIELMGKSLELLSEWLQGSKINKSWRGEKEREWIKQHFEKEFDQQGRGRELIESAMRDLAEKDDDDVKARMVTSAIRLSQIYKEDSNPPTPRLFSIDSELVKSVIDSILSSSEPSHNCIELVLVLLPLLEDTSDRLVSTVLVLPFLTTCQAVQARDLIFYLLSTFSTCPPPSLDQSLEIPCLVDLPLLNPFYVHAIVESSNGKVISPSYPTPRDLKLTHSLIDSNKFLLKRDWPLKVLDELLRSNTSPIFNNGLIPKDWDASESQLVKTCLVLMRIVSNVYSSKKVEVEERSRLLYNLIKVYMLEKDTTTTSQSSSLVERDLFRLPSIEFSISKLLLPLQLTSLPPQLLTSSSTSTSPAPLEVISNEQSSSTFYQQFQDFLSLYDSISLSNLNFSLLLLPPLSMKYESDYKKLLWCDYQHLSKNLNKLIKLKHLIADSNDEEDEGVLSNYLYPIEKNETILKAYLDSLVSSSLFEEEEEEEGFFQFIAVHHLSQVIFSESESGKEDRGLRTRLLKGLIGREKKDLIRLVMRGLSSFKNY